MTHPMVVAELACGTPPAPRGQTLADIGRLQQTQLATLPEVMALIEREKLYGLGCGLAGLAARFDVQYRAVSHQTHAHLLDRVPDPGADRGTGADATAAVAGGSWMNCTSEAETLG